MALVKPALARLRISEIFHSIQGESNSAGWPTVFVRLTGCPLRCHYCDTQYAFNGGQWQALDDIVLRVEGYCCQYVTVTGGEPLAQKATLQLLSMLSDQGYRVSLETSGAVDVGLVDRRVVKVVDIKTPGSGESARNLPINLTYLQRQDQLKFVICDRQDYDFAKQQVALHGLHKRCTVLFSPSSTQLPAAHLAQWILHDGLPVRLQLQLHKILWGDEPGR